MINEENLAPEVKKIIFKELPDILEKHPDVKLILWKKLVDSFADKKETESRFEILLNELRELKEESEKKWELSEKRWRELKEDSEKKWAESEKRWKELKEESDRRWETLLKEVRRVDRRIDTTIGALGARWGLTTEKAFRGAIKSILEELTDMKVERYLSYDEKGDVFGHPDQVELDVVLKNGEVWIIEIKSSVSKADMYVFDRKVKFFENKEGRKVSRKIVISPMIEPKAFEVAERLGIETFVRPEDLAKPTD